MCQCLDIFNVVEHLPLFLTGGSSTWLTGVDALEDAEASKVLEGDLKPFEDFGAADEGCVDAGVVLLLDFAHAGEFALGRHAGGHGCLDGLFLGFAFDAVTHGCSLFWWVDGLNSNVNVIGLEKFVLDVPT